VEHPTVPIDWLILFSTLVCTGWLFSSFDSLPGNPQRFLIAQPSQNSSSGLPMNQHELPFDRSEPPAKIQNEEVSRVFSIREVVDQVWEQHRKVLRGDKVARGLSTGIQQLDEMLGELMPGLHMLSSRPSMGKTALMLNIVEHLLSRPRRNVRIDTLR